MTPESQVKANRSMLLYRMLPAWKTLNEKINELDLGPVEGYAIIDLTMGPDAIATNGHGYCVYENGDTVNEMLNLWRQQDKEYEVEERKPIE